MKIQNYIHCPALVFVSICIAISLSLLRMGLWKEIQYGMCYVGDKILMMVYF